MKKLEYRKGYMWTQGDDVAISERQLFREACMPDSADESKFTLITDAEAAEYQKQIDAYNEEQKKQREQQEEEKPKNPEE